MSVLTDLQNRGVKDILIACVDGLKGGMSWYDYTPLLFSEKGYMFGNILYGHWSLHQGDSRIKIAGTLLCQYMCPQFLRPRANRGLIVLNIFWYVFFYNLFHDSFFLLAKHFHAYKN